MNEFDEWLTELHDEMEFRGVELLGRSPDWEMEFRNGYTPQEAVCRFQAELRSDREMDLGLWAHKS